MLYLKLKIFFRCVYNFFLCRKYPFLYIESEFYPWHQGYYSTWLDEIPKGWRKRFGKQLCNDIKEYLNTHDLGYEYHIDQVKEKWGALCWYDNSNSELANIIATYSAISMYVCVECGNDAEYTSIGWICPYCEKCANNLIKNEKIKFKKIENC